MALRDEIVPYTDGNMLVAPNLVTPGILRASDNGTMYTSEYYVMLQKLNQLISKDLADFQNRIGACVNDQGMLCREPKDQPHGQEQVDNYYGVLNACKQLRNTEIPRKFIGALFKYIGFMDNVNPGSHSNWASFMPRQPQLIAAMISAAFPSFRNPLHFIIRLLALPLYFVAAVTLLISCVGVDPGNADARRLSWHLWQATKGTSLMCFLAGKVWLRRLYSTYPRGMLDVANLYYQQDHPFKKYWITE